jgi:hypothetical protein
MAKKSGSKRQAETEIDEVVARFRREAAPAVAKALNLDSAEAVEAAIAAGVELLLAARAVVRSMPLSAEAHEHLDRAEREAIRAARMTVRGVEGMGGKHRPSSAKEVKVDFALPSKKKSAPSKRHR